MKLNPQCVSNICLMLTRKVADPESNYSRLYSTHTHTSTQLNSTKLLLKSKSLLRDVLAFIVASVSTASAKHKCVFKQHYLCTTGSTSPHCEWSLRQLDKQSLDSVTTINHKIAYLFFFFFTFFFVAQIYENRKIAFANIKRNTL